MANDAGRSYYELAQDTNAHTRLQTGLAAGNLLANSLIALQAGKAREEARVHAERLEASVVALSRRGEAQRGSGSR